MNEERRVTPYEAACAAQERVEADMEPGGPLYFALSALVREAEGVAFAAAGLRRADLKWPHRDRLVDEIRWKLSESLFEIVKEELEAPIPLAREERIALGALKLLVERGVVGPA